MQHSIVIVYVNRDRDVLGPHVFPVELWMTRFLDQLLNEITLDVPQMNTEVDAFRQTSRIGVLHVSI